MLTLQQEALGAWAEQFDAQDDLDKDVSVDGGDLVEWFADWRLRVREGLAAPPPSA